MSDDVKRQKSVNTLVSVCYTFLQVSSFFQTDLAKSDIFNHIFPSASFKRVFAARDSGGCLRILTVSN